MNLQALVGAALVALSIFASAAHAQENKGTLRILVGLPAGSAADAAARALAESFKDTLGQAVIVDNRLGAGGRIAAEGLKRSPPDGATVLLAPMGTTIFFPVISKVAYDPWKDFVHLSQVATVRLAFAVAPGTPAKSMKDYFAWAKSSPGKASFGSAGAGTPPHFLALMIAAAAGVELTHVPYKGGPPLVTDMLGGHIPAGMGTITDFGEHHRAGKLRMLAIGGATRATALPDVPTFREAGYDADGTTWLGMHARTGTPQVVLDRLASAIAAARRSADIQERFLKLGFELTGTTADQFVRIMQNDRAKWEPAIRASGFREE